MNSKVAKDGPRQFDCALRTPVAQSKFRSSCKCKRAPLPPDAICPTCQREQAVFCKSRSWPIHCEQTELFGERGGA